MWDREGMFTYKGDLIRDGYELKWGDFDFDPMKFEPFTPSPKLVSDINKSLKTSYPLLITGERNLREQVGQSVCLELNVNAPGSESGKDKFKNNYIVWRIKRGEKFSESIYQYRHADKKRDLEYNQMHPEGNPIKDPDHYFHPGHILKIMDKKNENTTCPVLEMRDVHLADPDFVLEFMDFLMEIDEIYIPEIGKRYDKKKDTFPMIIMTAKEGYLPEGNHLGIIYKHHMDFPDKDELMRRFTKKYWRNPATLQPFDDHGKEYIAPFIEKTIDLFLLTKDNDLLKPGRSPFPMTLPELNDTLEEKLIEICNDWEKFDPMLKQLEQAYNEQLQIGEIKNLDAAKSAIKNYIEDDQIRKAIRSLKLIQGSLAKATQNEISQLISRYNDISEKERMKLESELVLYPMRNKLNFDILNLLDTIE